MTTPAIPQDAFDYAPIAEQENASSGAKVNFGRCKITPRFIRWADGKAVECDAATYGRLTGRDRSLEYVFSIDIQEFKPDLQFTYERRVQVGGLDWNQTFKPALEALVGKDAVEKSLPDVLRKLHGAYICSEDVPQIATKNKPDRSKYNTIKLTAIYDTREKCYDAWQAKYGGNGGNGHAAPGQPALPAVNPLIPIGYDEKTWPAMKPDLARLYAKKKVELGNIPAALAAAAVEFGAEAKHVAALLEVEIEAAPAGVTELADDGTIPF